MFDTLKYDTLFINHPNFNNFEELNDQYIVFSKNNDVDETIGKIIIERNESNNHEILINGKYENKSLYDTDFYVINLNDDTTRYKIYKTINEIPNTPYNPNTPPKTVFKIPNTPRQGGKRIRKTFRKYKKPKKAKRQYIIIRYSQKKWPKKTEN